MPRNNSTGRSNTRSCPARVIGLVVLEDAIIERSRLYRYKPVEVGTVQVLKRRQQIAVEAGGPVRPHGNRKFHTRTGLFDRAGHNSINSSSTGRSLAGR